MGDGDGFDVVGFVVGLGVQRGELSLLHRVFRPIKLQSTRSHPSNVPGSVSTNPLKLT